MSAMVSSLLFSLVCVLCVVVVQAGKENVCFNYVDADGNSRDDQGCGKGFCCGECSRRYCCSDKKLQLAQERCPESSLTKSQIALIAGCTVGTVVLAVLFVSFMICCIAPCCLCYKKCRKRPNQRQILVINSNTGVNPAQQPIGYQSVPAGPPMPTAPPPSYQESTNPTHFPVPAGHLLQPLNQPGAPPPYSDDPQQPPYNPSC